MTKAMGIDIGGTFTDVVLIDRSSGDMATTKVLTTPRRSHHGSAGRNGRTADQHRD